MVDNDNLARRGAENSGANWAISWIPLACVGWSSLVIQAHAVQSAKVTLLAMGEVENAIATAGRGSRIVSVSGCVRRPKQTTI
jgi:hypothetical protein